MTATPLHYADLPVPDAGGEPITVTPGLHWLRLALPFALDHVNLWWLADGDGWTLVDTGIGLATTQAWWETHLDAYLDGKPLRRIIVTHHHPDHLGQAAWLAERCRCPVLMTRIEYATTQELLAHGDGARLGAFFSRHGLDPERAALFHGQGNRYRALMPALPTRVEFIEDGDVLTINDDPWQVWIGGGHSPAQATLYCPARGLWIAADQILPRISPNISIGPGNPDADPLGDFFDSLAHFTALDPATQVLPSHGRVFTGLHERIRQLQDHHHARLAELRRACQRPLTATEALPVMFPRDLDRHQLMFAMGEAIAHLQWLHYHGEVGCTTGADGVLRFGG